MQTWIMACAGLGALGLGLWWSRRHGDRPLDEAYLPAGGRMLVRARLPSTEAADAGLVRPGRMQTAFRAWDTRRRVQAYVLAPWAVALASPRVHLERRPSSSSVRVDSEWELSLYERPSWTARARARAKVAAVAGLALVGTMWYGRQDGLAEPARTPRSLDERSEAGCPGGVVAQPLGEGRWYVASLTSPTAHPFRTLSAHRNAAASTAPAVISPGSGHINAAGGHTNTGPLTVHVNATAFHTNTALVVHTNTDVRPFPGPL